MFKLAHVLLISLGIIVVGVHSCTDAPTSPIPYHTVSAPAPVAAPCVCPDKHTNIVGDFTRLFTGLFDAGKKSVEITKKKSSPDIAKKKSSHHKFGGHHKHHSSHHAPSHAPSHGHASPPAAPSHAPSTHSGLTGPPGCCP